VPVAPPEPSWRPDPTGRHDYRWWDGEEWTDDVSDDGLPSIDTGAVPSAPVGRRPEPDRGRWWIAAGVVAAAALVLYLVVGRRSEDAPNGGRYGVSVVEFTEEAPIYTRSVSLKAGESIRVRAEPTQRVNTLIAVFASEDVTKDTAEAILEFNPDAYVDADDVIADRFREGTDVIRDDEVYEGLFALTVIDSGFSGDADAGSFVAYADGAYTVAVFPRIRQADPPGGVRIVVEKNDVVFDAEVGPDRRYFDDAFFDEPSFYREDGVFGPNLPVD
jgi:hypothetical protein